MQTDNGISRILFSADLSTCRGVMFAYKLYRYYLYKEKQKNVGKD